MFSLFLSCLAIASACLQVVSAQYNSGFHRRYYIYRRPASNYPPNADLRNYFASASDVQQTAVASPAQSDSRSSTSPEKVQLDIYYETDCPDSMRFVTRQLYPLYREMESILDIRLIPYGKAREYYNTETKKYDFMCHHGPSECYGNTVQSCVISLYPEKKDQMNFIDCMENYPRPSQSAAKCARRMSLDWNKIEKCASGDEGNRLLHENAQLTENLNPRLYFVPWIVVNKVYSDSNQRMSLRNLKSVVCNAYKGDHEKCPKSF
ncbi:Gamma-interferon-inducible lysosomal thiol reductase, partial [Stegodyphus mimosarum]